MPWNPIPFVTTLPGWMMSQSSNTSLSYSYKPLAQQIGLNYHIAATAVNTTFGSLPVKRGTANGIRIGFEASFQLAEDWGYANISETDYTVKQWNNDMPDSVWIPAATAVVNYWKGGTMATAPPPPGGGVGYTNKILIGGTISPLNSAIGAAFKIGKTFPLCTALNIAFIGHLKLVTGLWAGLTVPPPTGTPPPYAFPWVSLT